MKKRLVITICLQKNYSLQGAIIHTLVADCQAILVDSRISYFDNVCMLIIQLAGSWDVLAKAETQIAKLAKAHQFDSHCYRTEALEFKEPLLPYAVQVNCLHQSQVLDDLIDYFIKQEITLQDIYCAGYNTASTNTPMMLINMSVLIPADHAIATFRDNFLLFCESLNIDAVLEPEK